MLGSEGATSYRRARHAVHEDARTLRCADALRANDFALAGALMNQSHASLRDDFEVSTPELDLLALLMNLNFFHRITLYCRVSAWETLADNGFPLSGWVYSFVSIQSMISW